MNGELRAWVDGKLELNWSPEQISAALRREFPDRAEMRVSPETIYQSCTCRAAGRCGGSWRAPADRAGAAQAADGAAERRGRIAGMVNVSERPAEAATGRCPGTGRAT